MRKPAALLNFNGVLPVPEDIDMSIKSEKFITLYCFIIIEHSQYLIELNRIWITINNFEYSN